MGILDRFRAGPGAQGPLQAHAEEASADRQAIARYRYLLRTAPPETIEQAHAEAFAQLTSEQRRRVLHELGTAMSQGERMAAARAADDPEVLARMATRAEIRQPGALERALGGLASAPGSGSPGLGGLMAGSFLGSMAGTVLGSMIAQQFFNLHPGAGPLFDTGMQAQSGTPAAQPDDATAGLIDDPFRRAAAAPDDPSSSDGFGGDLGGGDGFDA